MLLAVKSLAVYAATAALCLWAARRWVRRIPLGPALFLAVAPLLLTGRATVSGAVYAPLDIRFFAEPFRSHRAEVGIGESRTPMLFDVAQSMIPWQKAVRESVKKGRAPIWNRFVAAGEPLLAVQQASALHPFTAIGFLLPLGQAWNFQMSARFLLALLSAFLFCREMGCSDAPSLVGAVGWAFGDFLTFWIGYSVGIALAPFPLLLLGLARLSRDADRSSVAITAAALALIVLGGHPESLFFAVMGGGIFFIADLPASRRRLRAIALSVVAGMFAVGLTAVQLFPLAEALPLTVEHATRASLMTSVGRSVPLRESARRAASWVLPAARSEGNRLVLREGATVPGAYSGLLLLPLAWAGLCARSRYRWPLVALGVVGAAMATRVAFLSEAVTRLPLFDMSSVEYLVFLTAFALCGLAALGAHRLSRGEGRVAVLAGAAVTLLGVGLLLGRLGFRLESFHAFEDSPSRRIALMAAPTILLALTVFLVSRRRWQGAAVAIPVLLLAARAAEAGGLYPTCPEGALAPHLALLDPIPRGAPERFVAVGETFLPNASAMYELEDVRGYESMTLRPFYETFSLWRSSRSAWWFNQVDDLDRPFLRFLNVRWALAPADYAAPLGWRKVAAEPNTAVWENLHALPRAFVPARFKVEPDAARRLELLAAISDFAQDGVLAAGPEPSGDWRANGRASVSIRSYEGSSLVIDVDAEEPSVVATSLTAWPGWKASLDGTDLPPLSYNHAFLAFQVPRGTHRLTLRYLPTSFTLGLATSLLTLAAAIALGRRLSPPMKPAAVS